MENSSLNEQHPLGTRAICQVGLIVRDVARTAQRYAEIFGFAMPPIIETDAEELAHTRYRGAGTPARAKLAFFRMGTLDLELIEPIGGPSTWQEFLDTHGEGIHHIAFMVNGMARTIAYLEEQGMPVVQQGDYTGGRYAYIESTPALGAILELLENV